MDDAKMILIFFSFAVSNRFKLPFKLESKKLSKFFSYWPTKFTTISLYLKFFERVLGSRPKTEYDYDDRLEKDVPKPTSRRDYLDFIYDKIADNETSYKQLKAFAIRDKIVAPSFFGEDSDVSGDVNEFENIINSIHRGFDPEKRMPRPPLPD